jgi:PilZ domain
VYAIVNKTPDFLLFLIGPIWSSKCIINVVLTNSYTATRRKLPRFGMELPLEVRAGSSMRMEGITRDVSARGVYFYIEGDALFDRTVEFTVMFPKEVTGHSNLIVRCLGEVLRVETSQHGKIGVAAQIQRYEFIPSAEA